MTAPARGRTPTASATVVEGEDLTARSVRAYWNRSLHDVGVALSPVGSPAFFRELADYRFGKLEYLPRLVDFAGYPGRRVLEIGCGAGTDLARFARGGARVTGVELAESALLLARRNFAWLGLRGDFLLADGGRLPLRDAVFDLVYCHGVLQYAADPDAIVREAHRVLAPEGEGCFMAYNRRSWLAWMSHVPGVRLEHRDAPVFRLHAAAELDRLLSRFPRRRILTERFPSPTRLHRGLTAQVYNAVVVRAFRALPRAWTRRFGWHLLAFVGKQ